MRKRSRMPPNAAMFKQARKTLASICSQQRSATFEVNGVKREAKTGLPQWSTDLRDGAATPKGETGAIDLHATSNPSPKESDRDQGHGDTLYMRMRQTLTPETGSVVLHRCEGT